MHLSRNSWETFVKFDEASSLRALLSPRYATANASRASAYLFLMSVASRPSITPGYLKSLTTEFMRGLLDPL